MTTYEISDIIFSAIGVISTFVLTIIIIAQTSKLNKKQQKLEKSINDSQLALQKRQLKLDMYAYRREMYINLISFFDFCDIIKQFVDKDFFHTLEMNENLMVIKTMCQTYDVNFNKLNLICLEISNVFKDNDKTLQNFKEKLKELAPYLKLLHTFDNQDYFNSDTMCQLRNATYNKILDAVAFFSLNKDGVLNTIEPQINLVLEDKE